MKKFIIITFVIIIVGLLLKNVEVVRQIIKLVTDEFGKAFTAVTKVEKF